MRIVSYQRTLQLLPLLVLLFTRLSFHAIEARGEDVYGSMYIEEALVHYILPEVKRHRVPLILIPGHNLSSYIYLTTPDGRPGWAQEWAADGFDVYIVNDPTFDFSRGFNVNGFEAVPAEGAPPADPLAEQGWDRDIWRRWGFGDSEGIPYADTRFPTDAFAEFEANYPYISTTNRNHSDAISSLLELIGPGILVAHSAGGPQAVTAAKSQPGRVVGFVMIEPTNPPDENDFPQLEGMSMLGVYGDYIDSRNQGSRKEATQTAAAFFQLYGGNGEVVSLPNDLGIFGNTHLMMQDNNNAFIADLISTWTIANMDTQPIRRRRGRRTN